MLFTGTKLISLGKGSYSDHLNVMKRQPPFLAPPFTSRKDSHQAGLTPERTVTRKDSVLWKNKETPGAKLMCRVSQQGSLYSVIKPEES